MKYMKPVILYRPGNDISPEEHAAMHRNFDCITRRSEVKPGELVICRYSAWPFYKELEDDVSNVGGRLINDFKHQRWASDLGEWTTTLEGLTPETWRRLEDVPDDVFPVVLKGETNSRKFQWNTHMYAEDRRSAGDVLSRLQEDGLIEHQWIYVRRYVPLVKLMDGFRGMPVAKEFRIFVCKGKEISRGFYWSNFSGDLPEVPKCDEIPKKFVGEVIDRVGDRCNFYTIDVGHTQNGGWTVIDVGDAQQCGLSENDPEVLYKNLRIVL